LATKYQTESEDPDDGYLINLANQALAYLTDSDEYNAIDYLKGEAEIPLLDDTWIREKYKNDDAENDGLLESYIENAGDDFLELYGLLAEKLVEFAPTKEALKLFSNYQIVKMWTDASRTLVLEKKRPPVIVESVPDEVDVEDEPVSK
jgi:hypothetical protein